MKVNINIKRLSETATIPTYGSAQAAGADLYADLGDIEELMIFPGQVCKIPTGIALEGPEGTFGGVFARSGMATKRGLAPINKVGVIDADYRGEIIIALYNQSNEPQIIKHGERIAQFIILPYITANFIEVDTLDETERGGRGFGSTDKQ